ncbi:hypothetical protein HKX42_07570 [Salinisphaera sp. USBA-960]|uniref:hypothetical protein n=1 Tax=Salinisphaera orenii TaxID=856731 RepID=UPI000DBE4AEB|nr:hypothetical protein [Salifodinibacter halophilus]NNC26729.1 hypothetical protein [Salifodinibacter halophilus]
MSTVTTRFFHQDGKTFFRADGYDKLVMEAIVAPRSVEDDDHIGLHVTSMWLDELDGPADVEVPRDALVDRDQFTQYMGDHAHLMIRFLGNRRQFDAFVADELGVK